MSLRGRVHLEHTLEKLRGFAQQTLAYFDVRWPLAVLTLGRQAQLRLGKLVQRPYVRQHHLTGRLKISVRSLLTVCTTLGDRSLEGVLRGQECWKFIQDLLGLFCLAGVEQAGGIRGEHARMSEAIGLRQIVDHLSRSSEIATIDVVADHGERDRGGALT
jgi:hypothetical protein